MMVYLIAILVLLIDLGSKYLIELNESLHQVEIIPNFFYFTYAKNTGMAWSLFSDKTIVLTIISLFAVGLIIYYIQKNQLSKPYQIAFGLILGGALGNLFDRIVFGYVRDFLDFYIFSYNYPIFNLADSCLVVGVFLMIILVLKEEKHDK